jgi:hypothetical protein
MEVIKFQDFLDGSYKVLPLEESSRSERLIEFLLCIGAIALAVKLLPIMAPVIMGVTQ